jgi:PAS domain S-box-containing protein
MGQSSHQGVENMPNDRSADFGRPDKRVTRKTPHQLWEERFHLVVEDVQDYAIFLLDGEGRVSSWNEGAERIKGYQASEIIGKHFSRFYPDEDIRAGKPDWELEIAAKNGRLEDEGWRVRKDGSRFWANVVITALKDDADRLLGFTKVTRDVTERMRAQEALRKANEELGREVIERKNAERKLQESEESLRRLSRHLLQAQDEERRRIGRELHDSVGQCLAVLKMNLDALKSSVGSREDENARNLRECVGLAEDCIKEVRTISYLLYPPMLEEMGLRLAIPWYLEGFTQRSGVQTTFTISPDFTRLPRDVELAVFRILQESLTNVHRHSGSATAHVRVRMCNGAVSLEVQDEGKGIAAGTLERSREDGIGRLGVGLRGMSERTRQLGGSLEVSSTEQGATVRALIPCEESASAMARSA